MEDKAPKYLNTNWPEGKEGHNIDPERLECPICFRKLTPCENIYANENAELWSFHCNNCRTEYICAVPVGSVQVPMSQTEYIRRLEERIARLENIIMHTMKSPQNTKILNQPEEETIASKYAFLLKV